MSVLAALLAMAATADAAPVSVEREMLDGFQAACERVDDFDAMSAAATASGWEAIADDAEPRVWQLLQTGRQTTQGEGEMSDNVFRRTLGGKQLFLVASRYVDREGFWGNGCHLYDFDGREPFDPAGLEVWMGKAPTGVEDFMPQGIRRLWEPGWRSGVSVQVTHVPVASAIGQQMGVQGNVLIAQAIGGF